VVFEGDSQLPEGAVVSVSYAVPAEATPGAPKTRIHVPLVQSGQPGTVNLTGEQIAEILDEACQALHCVGAGPRMQGEG
jgi:hypothetical protein